MKHQQVTVNYWVMVKSSMSYLVLAFLGWFLFKLIQAVFWLPGYLQKNQEVLYKKMEDQSEYIISKYEKIPDGETAVEEKSSSGNEVPPPGDVPCESDLMTQNESEIDVNLNDDCKKTK